MSKVVLVDFDNTIFESGYYEIKGPQRGAREALQKIKAKGYEIHIYSCRTNTELNKNLIDRKQQIEEMKHYLDMYHIPYDEILDNDKPIAFCYIDDRAVGFRGDWKQTLKEFEDLI